MKKIKFWIRSNFGFSQRETNGFIFLMIVLFCVLLVPLVIKSFLPEPVFSSAEDQKLLDSVVRALSKSSGNYSSVIKSDYTAESINLHPFNPNETSLEDMESILGKKLAATIIKFRMKGGKFKVKTDLKKIYGLDSALYQQIQEYILLPDSIVKDFKNVISKSYKEKKTKLDINSAAAEDLVTLKGIGTVLSARIIKYREKLGGFISAEQYKEVYGLDSIVITEMKENLFLSASYAPNKISLNEASWQELSNHPYIGSKFANAIVRYREQQGKYENLSQLYLIKSIPAHAIERFLPYVGVE